MKLINRACYYYDIKNNKDYCLVKHKYIDFCDKPCNLFEIVSASPAFLNHMDKLYKNMLNAKKVDGFDDFVMHSTPVYFVNKNADGKETIVTVEEIAEIIKSFYDGNVPNLRLISCRAGLFKTDDGVAQKLANILGINVLAAEGVVVVYPDGTLAVQDPVTEEISIEMTQWKLFTPNNKENNNEN